MQNLCMMVIFVSTSWSRWDDNQIQNPEMWACMPRLVFLTVIHTHTYRTPRILLRIWFYVICFSAQEDIVISYTEQVIPIPGLHAVNKTFLLLFFFLGFVFVPSTILCLVSAADWNFGFLLLMLFVLCVSVPTCRL